jgi:hypothetical protein
MVETSSFAVVMLSADGDDVTPADDDDAPSFAKRISLDVPSRHTSSTAVVDER